MGNIACLFCDAIGAYSDICKGGWRLAKNKPFAYVCPACIHKDKTP